MRHGGTPLAPFLYAISTVHRLTISPAYDGVGRGTVCGELAREMLRDARFSDVTEREVPDEPVNALYVARR